MNAKDENGILWRTNHQPEDVGFAGPAVGEAVPGVDIDTDTQRVPGHAGAGTMPGDGSKGAQKRQGFREIVETVLVTLLIFFLVRAVIQTLKVEGDSMLPTLHTEQYLLVNKGLYFR